MLDKQYWRQGLGTEAATALWPKPAMRVLSALGAWLRTHERMVNIATGLGVGGIFLLRGLTGLLAAS